MWREFVLSSLKAVELPRSEAAITLLGMIAAHESAFFTYSRQINGPALGFWQMEPETGYREVQRYVQVRPERFHKTILRQVGRDPEWLVFDPVWACQCARIFLMAEPEPLPDAEDLFGMAAYAKAYWNTEAGEATVDDYYRDWMTYAC